MAKVNKLLVGVGVIGIAVTGVVAAITTYKAHDDIKNFIEGDGSKFEKVKGVAVKYLPTIGATVGTAGVFIASEFIGERKANELKRDLDKAKTGYNKVSTWYKDQSNAIKNAPKKTQEQIAADILKAEKERLHDPKNAAFDDRVKMYDPITKVEFEASRNDVILALNEINKQLVKDGAAMYEDFYNLVGAELPGDWQDFGWSVWTASAKWVIPWVDAKFEVEGDKTSIYYISDAGGGTYSMFEPDEDPAGEQWV